MADPTPVVDSAPMADLILSDILGVAVPHAPRNWTVICTAEECHAFKAGASSEERQWVAGIMRKTYQEVIRKWNSKNQGEGQHVDQNGGHANGGHNNRRERPQHREPREGHREPPRERRREPPREQPNGMKNQYRGGSPDRSLDEASGSSDGSISSFGDKRGKSKKRSGHGFPQDMDRDFPRDMERGFPRDAAPDFPRETRRNGRPRESKHGFPSDEPPRFGGKGRGRGGRPKEYRY